MKAFWGALLVLGLALGSARAEYPERPISLVVPLPSGGPTDAVARSLAEALSRSLGQPMVVENRPGADGAIGTRAVTVAKPDGYTLLFGIGSIVALPHLQTPPPFDVERDLAPVAAVGRFPFAIALHPSVPAATVAELVAYAKARPDELLYASSTAGEALAAAEFMAATGIKMTRVPYKGAQQAMPDLLTGRVQVMFAPVSAVLQPGREGKLRLLATTSRARLPAAPDVPTFAEAGIGGVDIPSWQAMFAPRDTPDPVLDRLSKALAAALQSEDVRLKLEHLMLLVEMAPSAELRARIEKDNQVWGRFVHDYNLAGR